MAQEIGDGGDGGTDVDGPPGAHRHHRGQAQIGPPHPADEPRPGGILRQQCVHRLPLI